MPPYLQPNGHIQTIVPALFRKVQGFDYCRERINTPDGDFLDLDWGLRTNNNLLIICHGLEGNSSKSYVKGMAKYFYEKGWNVLAWNYRGCSDEVNLKIRFYHSGATDDLDTVINHVADNYNFTKIHLLGFSLGGNLVLKYLGERGTSVMKNIHKAIGISVPTDLYASCSKLSRGFNHIYGLRFLNQLKDKVKKKSEYFPDDFNISSLKKIRRLIDFDDSITAPIHGFDNALHYYDQCSAQRFLMNIKIPTLIINAKNDPFLAPSCYPEGDLKRHPFVELITPTNGGHCGFADRELVNGYWSETLAWNYMNR